MNVRSSQDMRAAVIASHGAPSVLNVEKCPMPTPGFGEVRVRVAACALNHLDLWARRGLDKMKLPLPLIPGSDIAGVVDELGEGVEDIQTGDEVVLVPGVSCGKCSACQSGDDNLCDAYAILGFHRHGGCAQNVVVPSVNCLKKPEGLSMVQAASLPLCLTTAWHMLFNRAQLKEGERVLIWGASSGVGSLAIQMAKAVGAYVVTTAGKPEKMKAAQDLGADEVVNYLSSDHLKKDLIRANEGHPFDVVLEHVGAETFPTSLRALKKNGRLVTCGATTGAHADLDLRHLFFRHLSLLGSFMGRKDGLVEALTQVASGQLRPVVDRSFKLADIQAAHTHLEASQHFGKVVLEI